MALRRRRTSSCCQDVSDEHARGRRRRRRRRQGRPYLELVDEHGDGVELVVRARHVSHGEEKRCVFVLVNEARGWAQRLESSDEDDDDGGDEVRRR